MTKKMKKVVLIAPQRERDWEYNHKTYDLAYPPMGLLSIGTELVEAGYDTEIIDSSLYPDYLERIEAALAENPLFVGMSCMTIHVPQVIQTAKFIREKNPNTLIVLGGIHPTLFPEQCVENKYVDVIIAGEGEYPSIALAEAVSNGRDFENLAGIGYEANGKLKLNHSTVNFDIDKSSLPNFELLDMEEYLKRDFASTKTMYVKKMRSFSLLTGIGCPYKCTFCINTFLYPGRGTYRWKKSERILQEIELITSKYDAEYLIFRDEIFLLNKKRLEELLDGLEERKSPIEWYCTGRADFFKDENKARELLTRMLDNGCKRLGLGVESGSDKMLTLLKKELTVKDILNVTEVSKNIGVQINFSFMMGMPEEETEDLLSTIELIRKLVKLDPKCTINGPQVFRPYPGSELYDLCLQYGFRVPKKLEDWEVVDFKGTGFLSINDLPWIKNPKLVELINFHFQTVMLQEFKNINFQIKWIKVFSIVRLKLRFWKFPIEKHIYNILIFCKVHIKKYFKMW